MRKRELVTAIGTLVQANLELFERVERLEAKPAKQDEPVTVVKGEPGQVLTKEPGHWVFEDGDFTWVNPAFSDEPGEVFEHALSEEPGGEPVKPPQYGRVVGVAFNEGQTRHHRREAMKEALLSLGSVHPEYDPRLIRIVEHDVNGWTGKRTQVGWFYDTADEG